MGRIHNKDDKIPLPFYLSPSREISSGEDDNEIPYLPHETPPRFPGLADFDSSWIYTKFYWHYLSINIGLIEDELRYQILLLSKKFTTSISAQV